MRDHDPAVFTAVAEAVIMADVHPAGANVNVLRACHTA
jgi:hypothetical protein